MNPDQREADGSANKIYIFNRRKLVIPTFIIVLLLSYIFARHDWLALLGLPLIYLGWVVCAPNLNLIDGLLPIVAALVTAGLGFIRDSNSLLISGFACGFTWVAASLEAAYRLELQYEEPNSANNIQRQ